MLAPAGEHSGRKAAGTCCLAQGGRPACTCSRQTGALSFGLAHGCLPVCEARQCADPPFQPPTPPHPQPTHPTHPTPTDHPAIAHLQLFRMATSLSSCCRSISDTPAPAGSLITCRGGGGVVGGGDVGYQFALEEAVRVSLLGSRQMEAACWCRPAAALRPPSCQLPPTLPHALMAAGSQPQVPRYTCGQRRWKVGICSASLLREQGARATASGDPRPTAALAALEAYAQLLTLPKCPSPSRTGFPDGSTAGCEGAKGLVEDKKQCSRSMMSRPKGQTP